MQRSNASHDTSQPKDSFRHPLLNFLLLLQHDFVDPLFLEGTLVESKLVTLEDVSVAATALARSAGNNGVETTGLELSLESVLDLATGGETLGLLGLNTLALLLLLLLGLALATTTDTLAVVGLVPLPVWSSVDLDNGGAGQSVGTDEFVVGRVESDSNDTGLAGDTLGAPGKVAGFETETTKLAVATTGADEMDALWSDSGVGGLTTLLECSVTRLSEKSPDSARSNSVYATYLFLR